MRLVSLACSNTEIVHALGCADLLVGVDDHSDWPEAVVAKLPRVGPDLDVDVDALRALEPDLVLATLTVPGHERVVERLSAAGIPHIAPEPTSLEGVYRSIREIADLLEVGDRGEALVARMRVELDVDAPPPPDAPTLLVEWWPKPVITPGGESWTTDLIHAAGGRAPLEEEAVKSRPVSDEEVLALAPDAFVVSWCGVHPDKYRPDVIYGKELWRDLPALRERRVYCVPEAYLGRPGPRLVDGVRALRAIVTELQEGRDQAVRLR